MTRFLPLLAAAALLAACDKSPEAQLEKATAKASRMLTVEANRGRFTVTRVDVVHDSLAYGEKRGVYIIVDTQTGKEYIGVSGVGIAETGRHQSGKIAVTDER